MLITIEDCIGLSGLTQEEIDAIAEHERLPEIVAAELGFYLDQTPDGQRTIRRMIEDDIAHAVTCRDLKRAGVLKVVLAHYVRHHENEEAARKGGPHDHHAVA